jgi:hypothetical protein
MKCSYCLQGNIWDSWGSTYNMSFVIYSESGTWWTCNWYGEHFHCLGSSSDLVLSFLKLDGNPGHGFKFAMLVHLVQWNKINSFFQVIFGILGTQSPTKDRLCDLVVRVPGYRSRGPGFDSRRYQIFWQVVGLERGPLSLVRITEELLEWKSRRFGLENLINGRGNPFRLPRDTLYLQKLALTSPTSGGRSVGIVRLRIKSHGV